MRKKSQLLKKTMAILGSIILSIAIIPVSKSCADWESLINSQKLTPEKIGFKVIDDEVDNVLNFYISKGYKTPAELARESYKYLIKSVAYTGKDPLPKDYPQKEIPLNSEYEIENIHGDFKALRAINPLFLRNGICDDYNAAYACFMRRIGIPAMTVNGYYVRKSGVKDGHSWSVAKLGNKYYVFDSEIDDWIQNQLKDPNYIKHFCVEQIGNPRYELVDEDWNTVPKEKQQQYLDQLMSNVNMNGYGEFQYDGKYINMKSNTELLKGINTNPKSLNKKVAKKNSQNRKNKSIKTNKVKVKKYNRKKR